MHRDETRSFNINSINSIMQKELFHETVTTLVFQEPQEASFSWDNYENLDPTFQDDALEGVLS